MSCELCGFTGQMDEMYPRQRIAQCPSCSLVFYAEEVEPSELYNPEYFSGGEYRNYLADRPALEANFARRIARLRKRKPSGRLLEIGSAYGFFLELARAHWDVHGVEIAADAVRHARSTGLPIRQADFLSLSDEPEAYDIICLWDTIEHLRHPVRVIEKAARWLRADGIIAITTGDIASLLARVRGERWRLIHPPTHLFYFSQGTIGRAVRQAGLIVEDVTHIGYSRSFSAILHGLIVARRRRLEWLYRALSMNGRLDIPIYLNVGDIMMVLATKPGSASASDHLMASISRSRP